MNLKIKKLIGFTLFFIMISCTFVFASSDDISDRKDEDTFRLLYGLNLMYGDEDGKFSPERAINRAEFTALIIRMTGLGEMAGGENAKLSFSDVDEGHWAYGYLFAAKEMGLVDGIGDGSFGIENNVTYNEAIKIILNSLGYGELARQRGGYPDGYRLLAWDMGFPVSTEAILTRADAAKLIKKALTVNIMDSFGVAREGRNALNTYLGMNIMEGIVTSTPEFYGKRKINKGFIEVAGRIYKTFDFGSDNLVGENIRCYVKEDNGEIIIYYIQKIKSVETISVFAEDISKATTIAGLVYNDSGKEKPLKISGNATFYYNGVELASSIQLTDDVLQPAYGSVLLKDIDGDDVFDIIIIEDYSAVVVNKVSDSVIYDKYGRHISLVDITNLKVFKTNTEANIADIRADDVLLVAKSIDAETFKLYISNDKVIGELVEIQQDEDIYVAEIKDGDKIFLKLSRTFKENLEQLHPNAADLHIGAELTFLLDKFGRVCDVIKTEKQEEWEYGYLVGVDNGGSGLSNEIYLKMLTVANRFNVLQTKANVIVGCMSGGMYAVNKTSAAGLKTMLNQNEGHQIVRYKLDSGNKLAELYFADETGGSKYLSRVNEKDYLVYYNNVLGQKYYVDSDTVVFSAYEDLNYEDILTASTGKKFFSNSNGYYCSLYNVADGKAEAVVVHNRIVKVYDSAEKGFESTIDFGDSPILYINSSSFKLDEDGETNLTITGWQNGVIVTKTISKDLANNKEFSNALTPGTAIQYDVNTVARARAVSSDQSEQIIDFIKFADFNFPIKAKALWDYDVAEKGNASIFSVEGTIATISDSHCSVVFYDDFNQKEEYTCLIKWDTMILKYNANNKSFEPCNIFEIGKGSNVLIRQSYSKTKEIVVY